ncbi:MAG: DNA-binding response regulator [Phycisphaerales bacterium]|nr:MAG: DNA-binding response regulator [Phycisphaerales bacterium]
MAARTVLIVDDQTLSVRGLQDLLWRSLNMETLASVRDTASGYRAAHDLRPGMIIVDIAVEGDRGIEFILGTRDLAPILVLSLREETLYAHRCLRAGALGYASKREPEAVITQAIARVAKGQRALSERVLRHKATLADGHGPVDSGLVEALTDRQLEIFEMLGQGLTTEQIAARLHISAKTVQTYYAAIKTHFGLENFNQLVRRAVHFVLDGR